MAMVQFVTQLFASTLDRYFELPYATLLLDEVSFCISFLYLDHSSRLITPFLTFLLRTQYMYLVVSMPSATSRIFDYALWPAQTHVYLPDMVQAAGASGAADHLLRSTDSLGTMESFNLVDSDQCFSRCQLICISNQTMSYMADTERKVLCTNWIYQGKLSDNLPYRQYVGGKGGAI